jgi:hypothetical protein
MKSSNVVPLAPSSIEHEDIQAIIKGIAPVFREFVGKALSPIVARLDAIEKRFDELPEPQPGEDGEPGRDGQNVDMEEVSRQLKEHFSGFEKFASDCIDEIINTKIKTEMSRIEIPVPANGKDGEPGRDGKDGISFTQPLINRAGELVLSSTAGDMFNVGRVVGRQGIPGQAGKDADPEDVRKLVRIEIASELVDTKKEFAALRDKFAEDIPALICASVKETVAAIPPAKDGEPGRPGHDGADADIEEIKGIIKSQVSIEVREAVAELPPAEQGPPGEPGRDADMNILSELIKTEVHTKVHDAVAEIPPAAPGPRGEPGKDADPEVIATMVREQVSAVVATFEPEKGEPGKPGEPGRDGKDVDMGVVLAQVDERIAQKVAAIELPIGPRGDPGEPGPPGVNGKDADMDAAFMRIDEQIAEKVAAIEIPKGDAGPQGLPGKDADPEIIGSMVKEQVSAVAAAFVPEKGDPGPPGLNGKDADMDAAFAHIDERVEKAVNAIPRPADGHTPTAEELWAIIQPAVSKAVSEAMGAIVSVRDVMVNRSGELVATHSDGSVRVVGQVCGRDGTSVSMDEIAEIIRREIDKLPKPRDGVDGKDVDMDRVTEIIERAISKIPLPKDGKDGLGFDDLDVKFDNERAFTIKFERGERVKEFPFTVPFQIYRGIYKDVESYQKNDIVVFGGSAWIASRDPSGKPGDGQDNGWKLLAKAGRDGKPGEEGKKGDPGRPGRDLTMVGQGGPNDPSR